jgi:hypothetical protein
MPANSLEGLEKLKAKALELAPNHQWSIKWTECSFNRHAHGADSVFTDCECGACLSVILYPPVGQPKIAFIGNDGKEVPLWPQQTDTDTSTMN